ncbi:HPr family phosphocarrier protein [Niallia sp. BSM11]|uniref:HPr family phosphocarrier protein n=1 Tax=Niallia sp. BSM11 TaxID=3391576 RepID=UPI0039855426
MTEMYFNIIAITGFARPACLLVSSASMFQSRIFLEYNNRSVNLQNSPCAIMEVMSLEIKPGAYFKVWADGADEQKALQAIAKALTEAWGLLPNEV